MLFSCVSCNKRTDVYILASISGPVSSVAATVYAASVQVINKYAMAYKCYFVNFTNVLGVFYGLGLQLGEAELECY